MYRRPYHLLVVDDDPAAQYQTIGLLRRRDYVVTTAWTIHEAVARLAELPVDLIIAGVQVGPMSGLQFIVSCRGTAPEMAGILVAPEGHQLPQTEASRHDITPLVQPLDPNHFLMTVAEKLAGITRRQRWPRKRPSTEVAVSVEGAPGRLVDVSYGGLALQLAGESYELRALVRIDIPSADLRVNGELVWSARAADGATCVCGIAILGDRHPVPLWREFVDGLPGA